MSCAHARECSDSAGKDFTSVLWALYPKGWDVSCRPHTPEFCCAICGEELRLPSITSDLGRNPTHKCSEGHSLAIDVLKGELYCITCQDYVYLQAFDQALHEYHVAIKFGFGNLNPKLPPNDPAHGAQDRGSGHSFAQPPRLSQQGAEVKLQNERLKAEGMYLAVIPQCGVPLGLKGINNLGNTCFMSCILQVMLNLPLLRTYFLGDGHRPGCCTQRACGAKPCLACEMDALFGTVYNGMPHPVSPADFLFAWWAHADALAGYKQQDAHEFYLSLLSGLGDLKINEASKLRPSLTPINSTAPFALGSLQYQGGVEGGLSTVAPEDGEEETSPEAKVEATSTLQELLEAKRLQGELAVYAVNPSPSLSDIQPSTMFGASMLNTIPPSDELLIHGSTSWSMVADTALQLTSATLADPTASLFQGVVAQRPLALNVGYAGPCSKASIKTTSPHRLLDAHDDSAVKKLELLPLKAESVADGYQQQVLSTGSPVKVGLRGMEVAIDPRSDSFPPPKRVGAGGTEEESAAVQRNLVDTIFGGLLRSDVTCKVCGHTSTAYDPFLDISLDLVQEFNASPTNINTMHSPANIADSTAAHHIRSKATTHSAAAAAPGKRRPPPHRQSLQVAAATTRRLKKKVQVGVRGLTREFSPEVSCSGSVQPRNVNKTTGSYGRMKSDGEMRSLEASYNAAAAATGPYHLLAYAEQSAEVMEGTQGAEEDTGSAWGGVSTSGNGAGMNVSYTPLYESTNWSDEEVEGKVSRLVSRASSLVCPPSLQLLPGQAGADLGGEENSRELGGRGGRASAHYVSFVVEGQDAGEGEDQQPLNPEPQLNEEPASRRGPPGSDPLRTSPPGSDPLRTSPPGSDPLRTSPPGSDPLRTSPPGSDPLRTSPPGSDHLRTSPPGSDHLRTSSPPCALDKAMSPCLSEEASVGVRGDSSEAACGAVGGLHAGEESGMESVQQGRDVEEDQGFTGISRLSTQELSFGEPLTAMMLGRKESWPSHGVGGPMNALVPSAEEPRMDHGASNVLMLKNAVSVILVDQFDNHTRDTSPSILMTSTMPLLEGERLVSLKKADEIGGLQKVLGELAVEEDSIAAAADIALTPPANGLFSSRTMESLFPDSFHSLPQHSAMPSTSSGTPKQSSVPSTSAGAPKQPSAPSTSSDAPKQPSVPSTSSVVPTQPSVPSTSSGAPKQSSVPSTSSVVPTQPSVPSSSSNALKQPSAPSSSSNALKQPSVPCQQQLPDELLISDQGLLHVMPVRSKKRKQDAQRHQPKASAVAAAAAAAPQRGRLSVLSSHKAELRALNLPWANQATSLVFITKGRRRQRKHPAVNELGGSAIDSIWRLFMDLPPSLYSSNIATSGTVPLPVLCEAFEGPSVPSYLSACASPSPSLLENGVALSLLSADAQAVPFLQHVPYQSCQPMNPSLDTAAASLTEAPLPTSAILQCSPTSASQKPSVSVAVPPHHLSMPESQIQHPSEESVQLDAKADLPHNLLHPHRASDTPEEYLLLNLPKMESMVHTTSVDLPTVENMVHTSGMNLPATESMVHTSGMNLPATESMVHTSGMNLSAMESMVHTSGMNLPATESMVHTSGMNLSAMESMVHTSDVMSTAFPSTDTLASHLHPPPTLVEAAEAEAAPNQKLPFMVLESASARPLSHFNHTQPNPQWTEPEANTLGRTGHHQVNSTPPASPPPPLGHPMAPPQHRFPSSPLHLPRPPPPGAAAAAAAAFAVTLLRSRSVSPLHLQQQQQGLSFFNHTTGTTRPLTLQPQNPLDKGGHYPLSMPLSHSTGYGAVPRALWDAAAGPPPAIRQKSLSLTYSKMNPPAAASTTVAHSAPGMTQRALDLHPPHHSTAILATTATVPATTTYTAATAPQPVTALPLRTVSKRPPVISMDLTGPGPTWTLPSARQQKQQQVPGPTWMLPSARQQKQQQVPTKQSLSLSIYDSVAPPGHNKQLHALESLRGNMGMRTQSIGPRSVTRGSVKACTASTAYEGPGLHGVAALYSDPSKRRKMEVPGAVMIHGDLPGSCVMASPSTLGMPGSCVMASPSTLGMPGSCVMASPSTLGLPAHAGSNLAAHTSQHVGLSGRVLIGLMETSRHQGGGAGFGWLGSGPRMRRGRRGTKSLSDLSAWVASALILVSARDVALNEKSAMVGGVHNRQGVSRGQKNVSPQIPQQRLPLQQQRQVTRRRTTYKDSSEESEVSIEVCSSSSISGSEQVEAGDEFGGLSYKLKSGKGRGSNLNVPNGGSSKNGHALILRPAKQTGYSRGRPSSGTNAAALKLAAVPKHHAPQPSSQQQEQEQHSRAHAAASCGHFSSVMSAALVRPLPPGSVSKRFRSSSTPQADPYPCRLPGGGLPPVKLPHPVPLSSTPQARTLLQSANAASLATVLHQLPQRYMSTAVGGLQHPSSQMYCSEGVLLPQPTHEGAVWPHVEALAVDSTATQQYMAVATQQYMAAQSMLQSFATPLLPQDVSQCGEEKVVLGGCTHAAGVGSGLQSSMPLMTEHARPRQVLVQGARAKAPLGALRHQPHDVLHPICQPQFRVEEPSASLTLNPRTQAASAAKLASFPTSLTYSLGAFVRPEQLPDSEAWVCEKCCKRQEATKQLSIRRLPPLLTFHIKRFEHWTAGSSAGGSGGWNHTAGATSHVGGGVFRKLQSRISFPVGQLDMTPFTSGAILRERYNLRQWQSCAATSGMVDSEGLKGLNLTSNQSPGSKELVNSVVTLPLGIDVPSSTFKGSPLSYNFEDSSSLPVLSSKKEPSKSQEAVQGVPEGLPTTAPTAGRPGVPFGLHAAEHSVTSAPAAAAVCDPLLFSLLAVVCHKGDIQGGHYICYIKCGGHWYCCDDAWVTRVEEAVVAECQAYMLFYLRSDFVDHVGCGLETN
ncbi:hypothetical protein CEUSTIGMA_g5862.t1 [Chlamydomonas eustigma]|uniref:USP domain-containing protein n=1 Tax=Chlamydomonas eustigma TaxID=1157962 RepID=A0A250X6M7_9CHLO|nr:hypothetical protein CEUSTIGMA_g5862.t1 [Chlamydomonas eustigma]|eukprot:GAX78420.1 hypothetical protein CEUSTIGMA_g5862.t1 [Chlamydomonas eustigma]